MPLSFDVQVAGPGYIGGCLFLQFCNELVKTYLLPFANGDSVWSNEGSREGHNWQSLNDSSCITLLASRKTFVEAFTTIWWAQHTWLKHHFTLWSVITTLALAKPRSHQPSWHKGHTPFNEEPHALSKWQLMKRPVTFLILKSLSR